MENIFQVIHDLFETVLKEPPIRPKSLQNVVPNPLPSITINPTGKGISYWLKQLGNNTLPIEALLIRVLQIKFPRLAELLTLLGVIQFEFKAESSGEESLNDLLLDWDKLEKLLSKPDQHVYQMLLDRVASLEDVKALQALVLMLIVAPQSLLQLEYEHQGFQGLPRNNSTAESNLKKLIDAVNSPLGFRLPPDAINSFEDFIGAAKPIPQAGTLGSVIIDGPEAQDFSGPPTLNKFNIQLKIDGAPTVPTFELGDGWKLSLVPDQPLATSAVFQAGLGANGLDLTLASPRPHSLGLWIEKQLDSGESMILLGEAGSTCLSLKSFKLGFRFLAGDSSAPLFELKAKIEDLSCEVKADFLKFLDFGVKLPTTFKFTSDVEVGFVQGKGLTGQGGASGLPTLGLQFVSPLDCRIGGSKAGISVDQMITRLETKVNATNKRLDFRVMFRCSARGDLGPVSVVVDEAGVWLGSWKVGDNDDDAGILPPQGIGVRIEAGPVTGGGFLQSTAAGQFAGALQLKVLGIGVFAYGIYAKTEGQDASFVALIGVRLPLPGMQLGFGFAVSGFGGLVGVNRRADTDLLRERLVTGTSGDVLFNDDPSKNAARLLYDLNSLFPVEQSVFIVGPTLQINWLMLLQLDLGVFIELPGPRKIFIAGSARLQLGPEEFAIVYIRIDFIGGVDFTKSLIFFDAALINSHILTIFRISGGVSLRLGYGANKSFLLSIGGFHPLFRPSGIELPVVPRVGVSMSVGDIVWMKLQMYLALTSNSVQFGARIEAGLQLGPISANGWFGFDALIYIDPFKFDATIDAGFNVKISGTSLCGVRLQGRLSGPGPLVLNAQASVEILFLSISESVTIELDDTPSPPETAIGDLGEIIKLELRNLRNWRLDGADASILFRPNPADQKLFTPTGLLVWEQKRTPLETFIDRFEGKRLPAPVSIGVLAPDLPSTTAEYDSFGVGSYLNLTEAQKLNLPGFSEQKSGFQSDLRICSTSNKIEQSIQLHLIRRPKTNDFKLPFSQGMYINPALASLLEEKNGDAKLDPGAPLVQVLPETWNVHEQTGGQSNSKPMNSIEAFIGARNIGGIAVAATAQPVSLDGVFI